jgi:hypothetical protein
VKKTFQKELFFRGKCERKYGGRASKESAQQGSQGSEDSETYEAEEV